MRMFHRFIAVFLSLLSVLLPTHRPILAAALLLHSTYDREKSILFIIGLIWTPSLRKKQTNKQTIKTKAALRIGPCRQELSSGTYITTQHSTTQHSTKSRVSACKTQFKTARCLARFALYIIETHRRGKKGKRLEMQDKQLSSPSLKTSSCTVPWAQKGPLSPQSNRL